MEVAKQRSTILWVIFIAVFSVVNFYFWYQSYKLNAELQEGLEAIRSTDTVSPETLTRAELAAAYDRIHETEQRALDYLGIFESIGLTVAVLGTLGGAVGLILGGSVQEAQQKLRDAAQGYQEMNGRLQSSIKESEDRHTELHNELTQKIQLSIQNASIAELLISMARQQYELGYLQGAQAIYQRALKLAPATPVIPYRIGYILTQLEELDEAKNILEQALEIDPEFPNALASLGFVYRRKGDKTTEGERKQNEYYKLAEKYLLAALDLNPYLVDDDGESWNGALAGLYKRIGREKDAIYHYRQAAYITPQSSYPKLNLLLLEWKHSDTVKLIGQLEEVEQLLFGKIKKDKDTYWDRADILNIELALGRTDNVIDESLQTFFQVLPRDAKDVLPRVINSTEFILNAPSFVGDGRVKTKIIDVIDKLKAEQEKRNKDVT
jgi:tetratricopeptide (TPR) repeat protein